MEDKHAIDIVIPSFRLDEDILIPIIDLPKPADYNIHIYIIADNPGALIPENLRALHNAGKINLLVNEVNEGFSATRNKGIRAGNSKWVLLLDDDIEPEPQLLAAYAAAITQHEDALGFAGVTRFPPPFNAMTKALDINGSVSQLTAPLRQPSVKWVPTTNVMLNRRKIGKDLFDTRLTKGGEDIDLMVRNSVAAGEPYISVPDAVVWHPWWNNGHTRRMFRYGQAASQIAQKMPIKNYTYRDFTNTSETLLLLLLLLPLALYTGYGRPALTLIIALPLVEFVVNWLKAILRGKQYSPLVALYLMWVKNCWELGYLYGALRRGRLSGFAERIEMGFRKPRPSPFRLNRWKIIKLILLLFLLAVLVVETV